MMAAYQGTAPSPIISLISDCTLENNTYTSTLRLAGIGMTGKTRFICDYIEGDIITDNIEAGYITVSGNIYPKQTGTGYSGSDLGSSDKLFDTLYTQFIQIGNSTGGSITPSENNKVNIGSTTKRFKDLYLDGNIGSSTYKVNEINATTINGLIPNPSGMGDSLTLPIGAIVLICIYTNSTFSGATGMSISRTSHTQITGIYSAYSSGYTFSSRGYGDYSSYTFKLLSDCTAEGGASGNGKAIALAIRIS